MKEEQAVTAVREALDVKFGQDIVVMDLRELTTIADYFVIATATSRPQMVALADSVLEAMVDYNIDLHHTEGMQAGNWVLLDFGSIIVHLFDKENRDFYNLERVWGDAKVTRVE